MLRSVMMQLVNVWLLSGLLFIAIPAATAQQSRNDVAAGDRSTAAIGEIPVGFTPIFNGEDLAGWHVSRTTHQGTTPDVRVEDGAIVLRQHPYGQGGVLLSDSVYGDFELYLEVRPDPGTNGGVFFRSTESGSGYQIEVQGDGERSTGNLLGEMLRVERGAKADRLQDVWMEDEWNAMRLRVEGTVPRVTLQVNGEPMYDVAAARNDLTADARDGRIGLQVHWSSVEMPVSDDFPMHASWRPGAAHRYRNIAIRRLGEPEVVVGPAGMEFVYIEPGRMRVGRFQPECPDPPSAESRTSNGAAWTADDYERCRELAERDARAGFVAEIDRPFYIGRYEVTQDQWEDVMGTNPSVFQDDRVDGDAGSHPVDNVTWEDAQAFVDRLSERDAAATYRLPSELEWEYAARAGNDGARSWSDLRAQAWIMDTDKGTTHPVGLKEPNAWGLYDTLGNVWEWVQDTYNGEMYPDPEPPGDGDVRVLRGGSFLSDVKNATPFTHAGGPGNGFDVGFRVVREVR